MMRIATPPRRAPATPRPIWARFASFGLSENERAGRLAYPSKKELIGGSTSVKKNDAHPKTQEKSRITEKKGGGKDRRTGAPRAQGVQLAEEILLL